MNLAFRMGARCFPNAPSSSARQASAEAAVIETTVRVNPVGPPAVRAAPVPDEATVAGNPVLIEQAASPVPEHCAGPVGDRAQQRAGDSEYGKVASEMPYREGSIVYELFREA